MLSLRNVGLPITLLFNLYNISRWSEEEDIKTKFDCKDGELIYHYKEMPLACYEHYIKVTLDGDGLPNLFKIC